MATTGTQISVAEYLKTVYRPDCDYVDGFIEERNLGELDHALVQTRFIHEFMSRYPATGLLPINALRIRTGSTRYRVPDVTVTLGKPKEQVLTSPPLLCIEVLSPEDRMSRVNIRIQEYLDFGVPEVWVADPAEKQIWIYQKSGMRQAHDSVKLDGTTIEIPFAAIFD